MTLKRRDFLTKAAAGAAGAAALTACGGAADSSATASGPTAVSGPKVEWRLATSFPRSLDIIHGAGERIAERVSALTGGQFTMRVFAAGEIVPALQVMDAVQQSTVHCGVSPGYYYIGKSPALAFDSALPFGLSTRQQVAWLYHGGGLELLNAVYADFGIITFPCMSTGGQMGGWFRRPVNTLADLSGLRMRIPGIGGEIMSRLGVTVQVLGAADIYPALERGAIDATEFVGPYDDEKLGFYQVARNYYYPGWWEPGVTSPLMINLEAYRKLPPSYQQALQVAAADTLSDRLAAYDAASPPVLRQLVRDHGVVLREFSTEIMDAAWKASNAYLEEQAADDANFKKVYDNWKQFRADAFPYFAGNELAYANFAFPKLGNADMKA
ncbi:MAG: ABC transporter substrate-binding protein [Gemmatimonadetes bacterium]|nr:ABC transporter substrate-binding protein [Gemmatimonadota bacterium]